MQTKTKIQTKILPRAKSLLGKGQIYLPKEGFKKAYSWAEGVVTARQVEKVGFGGRGEVLIFMFRTFQIEELNSFS